VGIAVAVLCSTFLVEIPPATAAVPTFPDNVVVFPDRDFVTIEGYQDRLGQTATVEVTRPGAGVIGSAQGIVQAGDVAFEINHPGGYCWGAGTGLNVTPDIRPLDTVSIRFGSIAAGDTTVQGAYVTADSVLSGNTVTVKGHIAAGVNRAQFEQRIIEPALKDTTVGRRDVRALPGPLAPAPKGGYTSGLEFDLDGPNTFTATYVFDEAAAAQIAANAGLGERAMAWQMEDAAANRQGLTIAEFGELGGPGMGGCPNGPLQSGPPGPTNVAAATVTTGIKLTWTPALAIPGTPAITGYRATAVAQTDTNSEQVEIGRRISGQGATGTTITGLAAGENYDIYVVAVSSVGETFPAVHAVPVVDSTAPTAAASPSGGAFGAAQSVTLTANETGAELYFTTDGSAVVLSGGGLSETATRYTAPIAIDQTTTLRFVAFDASGNISQTGQALFTIDGVTPATPVAPGAARIGALVAGDASVTVNWLAPLPVADAAPITGYTIRTFVGASATPLLTTTVGDVTSTVIGALSNGTAYTFDVAAVNSVGTGAFSALSAAVTPDGTAPTVTARTPAANAVVQSQLTNVTTTFSEAVRPATLTAATFTLRAGSAPPVAAAVTYNAATRVATLNPTATLAAGTRYTATLSSGVRDLAGNALGTTSWSVSTGPAPVITARSPGNGAVNVRRGANVTFTTNRALVGVNGARVRLVQVSNGAGIGNVLTLTGNTVTFNPGGASVGLLSPNTQYRLMILAGMTDAAGNPLAPTSWMFTTGALT
jgi:hypothetical protein